MWEAVAHLNAPCGALHTLKNSQDEREGLVGALRNEAKAAGIPDTPEAGLDFLISRIKSNLHIVLCFSPVGDIFRIRENLSGLLEGFPYRVIRLIWSRHRGIQPPLSVGRGSCIHVDMQRAVDLNGVAIPLVTT